MSTGAGELMATCKSCEADITWAETKAGKMMPLDAKPTSSGTFVLVKGKTHMATDEDRRLHRELFTSHFSTCPGAGAHRRQR